MGSTSMNRAPPPGRSSTADHAAQHPSVLGGDRHAEPGPGALAGVVASAKRSKMRPRSSSGTPGPASSTAITAIPDGSRSAQISTGPPACTSALRDEVADHPLQVALVRADRRLEANPAHRDRQLGMSVLAGEPMQHVRQDDVVGGDRQLAGGLEPGHLEQVDDELVELVDLGSEQVQRVLATLAQLPTAAGEHVGRGADGRHRGAQLVTDVGHEAALALDPLGERVGHVVEGHGEPVEVGIRVVRHAARPCRRSPAAPPRPGDTERAEGASGYPHAEHAAEHGDRPRPDDQDDAETIERRDQALQREDLDVVEVAAADRDRDDGARLTAAVEAHRRRLAGVQHLQHVGRQRFGADCDRGQPPLAVDAQHRHRAGFAAQRRDHAAGA